MNLTSTKPPARAVPLFTHHGKVPLPACISTLGLLGALGSAATTQRGLPPPIAPQVHPTGTEPTAPLSKLTACARAIVDASEAKRPIDVCFISISFALSWMGQQRMHHEAE